MALLWYAGRLALNFLSVEISSGAVPFSIYNTLLKHSSFFSFSLILSPQRDFEEQKKQKTHSLPVSFAYAIGFLPLQTNFTGEFSSPEFRHSEKKINKSIDYSI